MGATRKALLIGVGSAPGAAHAFSSLDEPVTADLRQLGSALEGAGYEVTTLRDPSRAEIGIGIHEAARDLAPDATLLLYFTGHGIRIGDTDYLVPHDARAPQDDSWLQPYLETLLPTDISSSLGACRTGTVLWAIDACRDDAGSAAEPAFGSRALQGPPSGRYALLLGCSAGQRSGYTADGSFFARGLAEAMGPLTAARTVQEVYDSARAWTRRVAHRHEFEQLVSIHYVPDHEHEVKSSQICEGRQLLENWRAAVDDDTLWNRVRSCDMASVPKLKESLAALVEECARTVHAAQERLPDPWADDDFPVRLLHRRLPPLLPEGACLSAVEATAVIAAPFLYEAAWADRLSQAAEIDPLITKVRPGGDAHRRLYEQICDHHGHIARKVADCERHERVEDAQSVALWLVHRWIAERFETDEVSIPDAPVRRFAAALLKSGDPASDPASDRVDELSTALSCLAGAVGVEQAPDELPGTVSSLPLPGGHQPLRLRPLTALLHLAALLSADARVCPPVMAEHLAVSDPVLPQTIVQVAREMDWETTPEGLHLDALSPHPATHAALVETAERADLHAARLRKWHGELPATEAALLTRVPTRVTDRRLRPRRTAGQPAYEVPLLRFHLAQTEVRELLMGENLYGGEPALALRELYQNAMDACRYRAMRWAYLTSKDRSPESWTGRIRISRGSDSRGTYIDCVDNGVGMGVEQLKNTFAEAGSRFERSRSFRREQATWLRHDPALRLYPNSRFGIGVFSYFMLAEEMTIITRQVAPDGSVNRDAVRVDIPGSGSLFRIQHYDAVDEELRHGGTRVRLYLRDEEALQNISCVQSLRDQIGVAEFRLDVSDAADGTRSWDAGALRTSPALDANGALEAVPGELWWVRGQGAILCDGIMTDRRPMGYVLNLKGPHAGELSVDRKTLQSYDHAWAEGLWRQGAELLRDWQHLDLPWVWELDRSSTAVARVLWRVWRGKHVQVPFRDDEKRYDLDRVGWFHLDAQILDDAPYDASDSETMRRVRPWRTAVYGRSPEEIPHALPSTLVGYPVPEPGDAHCANRVGGDWRRVVAFSAEQAMNVQDVVKAMRRNRMAHPSAGPPRMTGAAPQWQPSELDRITALCLIGAVRKNPHGGFQQQQSPTSPPAVLDGLARASENLGAALDTLVAACGRYGMMLPATLPDVPPHHRGHVCTEEEIRVLFTDNSSPREGRWPWQIQVAANRFDMAPHEVRELMSRFVWLGRETCTAEELDTWLLIDERIRERIHPHLRTRLDGLLELSRGAALSGVLADGDISIEEIDREFAQAAERIGAIYEHPTGEGLNGRPVSISTLEEWRPKQLELETYADMFEELREAGIAVPKGADELFTCWDELPLNVSRSISGTNPYFDDGSTPVQPSAANIFAASANLGEELGVVHSLIPENFTAHGGNIPVVPPDLIHVRVTWKEEAALQSNLGYPLREMSWTDLSADRLAAYAERSELDARAAYRQLARFRPLGALVPVLSAGAIAALPDTVPTALDTEVLNPSYRVSEPGTPLTPLDLVSLAGQFGEPVSRTRARFEPYRALLPGESIPDAPDTIPLWQDLILLSEYLDGQLPSLTGKVTAEQVAFAADGVEESAAWVVERLRVYADAFALDLSEVADRG